MHRFNTLRVGIPAFHNGFRHHGGIRKADEKKDVRGGPKGVKLVVAQCIPP